MTRKPSTNDEFTVEMDLNLHRAVLEVYREHYDPTITRIPPTEPFPLPPDFKWSEVQRKAGLSHIPVPVIVVRWEAVLAPGLNLTEFTDSEKRAIDEGKEAGLTPIEIAETLNRRSAHHVSF